MKAKEQKNGNGKMSPKETAILLMSFIGGSMYEFCVGHEDVVTAIVCTLTFIVCCILFVTIEGVLDVVFDYIDRKASKFFEK